MLELTIKGNSPAELFTQITGLYGMLHAGRLTPVPVGSPAATGVSDSAAACANLPPTAEADGGLAPPVEPEKVDPPRKPGRPKKQPEPIDLKANLEQSIAETPAPAPVVEAPAEKLDREAVRHEFLTLLNDVREAIKDDTKLGEVKNAVFARFNPPLVEAKVAAVPDDRLPELLAAVRAERAARLSEV